VKKPSYAKGRMLPRSAAAKSYARLFRGALQGLKMHRWIRFFIVAALVCQIANAGVQADRYDFDIIIAGEKVATEKCGSCHVAHHRDGDGNKHLALSEFMRRLSQEEIDDTLANDLRGYHVGAAPIELTAQERGVLLKYLAHLAADTE
jgi:mono/diheme cytochrome c family protein